MLCNFLFVIWEILSFFKDIASMSMETVLVWRVWFAVAVVIYTVTWKSEIWQDQKLWREEIEWYVFTGSFWWVLMLVFLL